MDDAAKSCSALAPLDAGEAWIDKQGKDEWNEMVWQIELISDQMLDFIEDIHDSLFFGFHNTVGKIHDGVHCHIGIPFRHSYRSDGTYISTVDLFGDIP